MTLAFPGAVGFAQDSIGGRGGTVYFVTNLNDSGAGSLRAALTASGPRIVVFLVAGTIRLATIIVVTNPYLTIAGQTAPGSADTMTGSVQVRGPNNNVASGIMFASGCHNVIVRYLKVRIGGPCPDDTGEPFLTYGTSSTVHHVFFDHCSIQWGTDAQAMFYGNVNYNTLSWCLIAEGGNNSTFGSHSGSGKGPHVFGDYCNSHHNLYACNTQRNPLIEQCDHLDQRNDLVYNWFGNNAGQYGVLAKNSHVRGNVINCHYIQGPSSGTPNFFVENGAFSGLNKNGQSTIGTKLFTSGNWGPLKPTGPSDDNDDWTQFYQLDDYWYNGGDITPASAGTYRLGSPIALPFSIPTDPTSAVKALVLADVGANAPFRDEADQAVINNVLALTGGHSGTIDYQNGGIAHDGVWPDLATGAPSAPTDTNADGIPDDWCVANGYSPSATIAGTTSGTGWTVIEDYINDISWHKGIRSGGGGDETAGPIEEALVLVG